MRGERSGPAVRVQAHHTQEQVVAGSDAVVWSARPRPARDSEKRVWNAGPAGWWEGVVGMVRASVAAGWTTRARVHAACALAGTIPSPPLHSFVCEPSEATFSFHKSTRVHNSFPLKSPHQLPSWSIWL